MKGKVAVLDAGGQYVDLVRKAVERLGYPAKVLALDMPMADLAAYNALIISGSPADSESHDAPKPDPAIWECGKPTLGICYGMQAMASSLGGKVERGLQREDGRVTTTVDTTHALFVSTKAAQTALFTHGNFVTKVPLGFTVIGQHTIGKTTVYSAIAKDNIVGVQFHPEVFDDTPEGYQIFKNFLETIAGLEPDSSLIKNQAKHTVAALRAQIREAAQDRHVIAFVSGGVDSSVMLALAATEIAADKLHAYYIDNGLMRDEDDQVIELLQHFGIPITKVDAEAEFSGEAVDGSAPLMETTDPQTKRQIIGKAFIAVQNRLVRELGLNEAMLLQGTNAADRIESGYSKGGQHTALIKTHHNQVQEVQDLKARGLLIEPLDELFKDEVRAIGRYLGLPPAVVDRHPFPGPGLAIRILCAKGDEFDQPDTTTQAAIQEFMLRHAGLAKHQTATMLLPIRNVGVGGDERSHVSAVAVQSDAGWEALGQLALELPATFRDHVNRIIVALGPGKLGQLSVTPTTLSHDVRQQLRHADRIVFEEMRRTGAVHDIKQCPVVLLPLSFGKKSERSIVLRPVTTSTFMTVQAMLPSRDLSEDFVQTAATRILKEVPGIARVFLDLTGKPPGTTEWE